MEEAWSVPDVYLLAEGPDGEMAVPELTLAFRDAGLALAKADGEAVWDRAWTELEQVAPVERSVLPDGRDGVVIAVVERGHERAHRFVLATDDADAMEQAVRQCAGAHGLRTRSARRAVSRLLMTAVVLAALATMAVLLLSAAHVIHF